MRPRRLGAGLLLALVALAGALAAEAGREPQVLQEPQPTANAAAAGSAPAPPPSISRHHHHQRRRQQHWEPGDARAAAEVASRARDASPHDASDDAGAGEDVSSPPGMGGPLGAESCLSGGTHVVVVVAADQPGRAWGAI